MASSSTSAAATEEHAVSGSLASPKKQNPKVINDLVTALTAGGGKKGSNHGGYSCRKNNFALEGRNMTVSSWKFNDWDYKKSGLPTYARGLFTYRNPGTGNHEIVIRGYDKFFNINETAKTHWSNIKENTLGPYELTLKENGCIIFMSGLPDGSLLVCSKHSTGARQEVEISHASAGEKWIDRHLESVGKTRKQLAKELRDLNVTAVAELCDDSFEEHILAYTEDKAGLYLHGLNFNVPTFTTCAQADVQKFAEKYGMRKTAYFEMHDVESLKKFLEEAAETGSWEGNDVEGFVIRCKARDSKDDPHWHDWFFKYKFEEPYLMYRQWREVTKAMISGKSPKIKKHVQVTNEYLAFAKWYLQQNPAAAREYQANHGIIRLREEFLKSRGVSGSDLVKLDEEQQVNSADAEDSKQENPKEVKRLVLAPVATLGCGKTTVAVALSRLFQWAHIQNDNIQGSARPARFVRDILGALQNHKVVIADRNNHQKREREQLIGDLARVSPQTKVVALHYVHDRPDVPLDEYKSRIRKATQDRVFARGDKHQTIHASTKSKNEITKIMEGFLYRFEPLDHESPPDWAFHNVIDLDIEADSRKNLETIVKALHTEYPSFVPEVPSTEQLDEAIQFALSDYVPEKVGNAAKKRVNLEQSMKEPQRQPSQPKKAPKAKIEYFAAQVPTQDILDALNDAIEKLSPEQSTFFYSLVSSGRVHERFHVTLIHQASLKIKKAALVNKYQSWWDRYYSMIPKQTEENDNPRTDSQLAPDMSKPMATLSVRLDHLVFDNRIMAISVTLMDPKTNKPAEDFPCANNFPHITIGTRNLSIKNKESNDMLEHWKAGGEDITAIDMGGKMVEGVVRPVLVGAYQNVSSGGNTDGGK